MTDSLFFLFVGGLQMYTHYGSSSRSAAAQHSLLPASCVIVFFSWGSSLNVTFPAPAPCRDRLPCVLGRIMLPMVLKRYETEEVTPNASPSSGGGGGGWSPGQAKKSDRKVIVPHRLDVSNFMAPSAGAKVSDLVFFFCCRRARGEGFCERRRVAASLAEVFVL